MSVVCVLTPVVVAGWPAISAAVTAAAVSLGYTVVDGAAQAFQELEQESEATRRVRLDIDRSEVVTDTLGRGRTLSLERDGVTVAFARDARGRVSLHVEGEGRTEDELRELGGELAGCVVQRYVYDRVKAEMAARECHVVEEETDAEGRIRLKVRRWES